MPYKFESNKKKIDIKDDKIVKLKDCTKRLICELYKTGEYSQRKLALEFNVSRRLIQFIICPDKLKQNLDAREKRGGSSIYYNKDKHTKAMKNHRDYKKELDKNGKLV